MGVPSILPAKIGLLSSHEFKGVGARRLVVQIFPLETCVLSPSHFFWDCSLELHSYITINLVIWIVLKGQTTSVLDIQIPNIGVCMVKLNVVLRPDFQKLGLKNTI